jgi:hypothetical protein
MHNMCQRQVLVGSPVGVYVPLRDFGPCRITFKAMPSSSLAVQSLQRPWSPHSGSSVILLRHLAVFLCTSDQRVAKVFTYTGQHNTETQRQTSMPRGRIEPTIPVTKQPRPTPQTARPPDRFLRLCVLDCHIILDRG